MRRSIISDYIVEPLEGDKEFKGQYNLKTRSKILRQVLTTSSVPIWEERRGIDPRGHYNDFIWNCRDREGRRAPPDKYKMVVYAEDADRPDIGKDTKETQIVVTK